MKGGVHHQAVRSARDSDPTVTVSVGRSENCLIWGNGVYQVFRSTSFSSSYCLWSESQVLTHKRETE